MNKNTLYAMILYSGFVGEKGRLYTLKWNLKYKSILKTELGLWTNIVERMKDQSVTDADFKMLDLFLEVCNRRKVILRNHSVGYERVMKVREMGYLDITTNVSDPEETVIIELLEQLLRDASDCLQQSKFIIPGTKLSEYVRVLHNLPRYFFTDELEQRDLVGTSFDETLEYMWSNTGELTKAKYSRERIAMFRS